MNINIMGVTYEVKEVDEVSNTENLSGLIDYRTCEILIDKNMALEAKEHTLVHEIVHGILSSLGMYDLNADEGTVQRLASSLYATFKPFVCFKPGLKEYKTCDLVAELGKREGVEKTIAEPYEKKNISAEGPAIVLIVTD